MMATSTSSCPEPSSRREWDVSPADGEDDIYFVSRWWHHYFGTVHDYWEPRIPTPLAQCLGWCDEFPAARTYVATFRALRVGAGLACVFDRDGFIEQLPTGRFDGEALAGDRNGWLMLGAVDPAWRGRGIGRELFRRRLSWLADEDVDIVASFGWERDGASSRPLFRSFDFVPIQRFGYEVGGDRDACPDCGVWPSDDEQCQCEFTLWALDGGDVDV